MGLALLRNIGNQSRFTKHLLINALITATYFFGEIKIYAKYQRVKRYYRDYNR